MLHYYVVLLLINWPCVRTEDGQVTTIPDQLAVASININQALKKPTTVIPKSHIVKYVDQGETLQDNLKGFHQPIVVPDAQYESTLREDLRYDANVLAKVSDILKDDPIYSPDARILFNLPGPNLLRRSFDGDSQYNEFELLKVNNNTPAIANYHEFYDDSYVVNEGYDVPDHSRKKSRLRNRDESYTVENYPQNKQYFYSDDKDKVRKSPERQHIRVNQHESNYPEHRDRQDQKSKFLQPLVVVEPASYKVDLKYGGQSITTKLASTTENQPQASESTMSENPKHINQTPSANQRYPNSYNRGTTSRHYNGAEDSMDVSEESMDYSDVTERSRKVSKSRRRPFDLEASKKLPKEHREIHEEVYEPAESKKRFNPNRMKQRYRHRNKHYWPDEDKYGSAEDSNEDDLKHNRDQNGNKGNWNQPDPSDNVLQANDYEVNQLERPKLVPVVPVNIVPVGNFDHATALGNSQGFDMSNVMLSSISPGATLVSTAAPLISTSQPIIRTKGANGYSLVNSVSDVIVGQNSMQNPMQTVVISQPKQNMKTQFLQSTMTPIYAVSTTASSTSQGQSTTSRPIFAASTTVAPVQHLAINPVQAGVPVNQILVAQPTLHTFANIGQATGNNNIQTQALKAGNLYQVLTPKNKLYTQNGQIVPAFLHANVNVNGQGNQNQNSYNSYTSKSKENAQIQKATKEAFDSSMRQLHQQIMKNQGIHNGNYQTDAIGSTSNTNTNVLHLEKAQLPNLGTKNVEIVNPNLNQNTFGLALASPLGVLNQYPAAVLTTPIPILSTTNFATIRPVLPSSTVDSIGLNNYVDTLTELGSKISPANSQALYNPIHFVPNLDLLKSQTILNSKGNPTDSVQQSLNLVPSIAGGNFYKSNSDLVTKPKLRTDLEKYAEEMLKESLRTIYNTHKWNNDRKFPRNISLIDSSPAAKLKNELLRYRPGKDTRDHIEGHHTENKYHVVESRPGSKRPDFSMAKLEELLMNDFKLHPPLATEPIHVYHHHSPRPGSYGRPVDQGSSYSNNEAKHVRIEINDYLTPPRPNSFVSKSPFHDKPVKKRPNNSNNNRYKNHDSHRSPGRNSHAPKISGPEPAGSNIYEFNAQIDNHFAPHYERHQGHHDYRKRPRFDQFYPSITTPFPNTSGERKVKDVYDMNHPRTHNLLGLLMKNKKLPPGMSQSPINDDDDLDSLFNDDSRQRKPILDLSVFQKKSDGHPNLAASNVNRLRLRNYKKT